MAVKITYATMSADNEELNQAYEKAVDEARSKLGQTFPVIVNGEERTDRELYEELSPIDSDIVVARYAQGTIQDVDDAVAAAKAFTREWEAWGWEKRRDLMLRAADIMDSQIYDIAALMSFEIGKNRLEALGDVAETVEFFRYYSEQITERDGFVTPLKDQGREDNVSVLRPWGVWVVVSPFNFPMALAAGPSIAALLTGNTVIIKPSNTGALMALEFYRVMREAGLPKEALHILTGRGSEIGDYLTHHDDIDGLTFTGSYEVGMDLYRTVAEKRPKPVAAEMGGKNPAVVTASADLDTAVEGIVRGAFGLSGQKCSATSRVYVEDDVYDEFVDKLVARTDQIVVGEPTQPNVFMGPVIDQGAVARFKKAVTEATDSGGQVLAGGEVIEDGDLARGNFVQPTVVTAPRDSWIWKEELFVPFLSVMPVEDLEEGLRLANDTEFGLTAGLFSGDEDEIERWFEGIQAGVTYVNRAAGATTGAWPDVQSFGGWKGSGTSGAGGGGPWYLRQYLREQSRTVVR
ncbi:MAG TPA: aldehyde dehydrogenase family protein [Acidimicrobiia bacterium]|nr:aldehyde dehydrogenase family protein [Acidimicrobiia bacterium]